MHYLCPEMGGGVGYQFVPNFTEFVVLTSMGVFSAHIAHDLGASRTISHKNGARQIGVYPSKHIALSK